MRRFMIVLGVLATLLLAQQGTSEPIPPNVTSNVRILTIADEALINRISILSKTPQKLVIEIVGQAEELSYKDFPNKIDILALIATESMFKNEVTDGSGSCGLAQVNAKANSLDPTVVCKFPMTNMEHGVRILRENFIRLGNSRKALLAYNAGVGNFLKGNYNEDYHRKFLKWKGKLNVL